MNVKRALVAVLAALASLLLVAVQHLQRPPAVAPVGVPRVATRSAPAPALGLGEPALERQVLLVIESMDRTGNPPDGVAQGGRRGGRRGSFENAEGRLPRQPGGYYTETDVWPRGPGGRGAQRLIFGRGAEVYYSADHYRTFARIR